MSKHTPAPWMANLVLGSVGKSAANCAPENPMGVTIARLNGVNNTDFDGSKDEDRDNAQLIAAAPELLESIDPETLEAIAAEIETDFKHTARAGSLRLIAKAQRAAIAKATGGQPCRR